MNTANGIVTNDGTIITGSDIINDTSASMSGNGTYSMQRNFANAGTYGAGNSTLDFFGTGNSFILNKSGSIYTLQVRKDSNGLVNMLDAEEILDSVIFLNDKNWIKMNDNILVLGTTCNVANYSNKRFFITNGNGLLKKLQVNNNPFVFPVGFNKNTYNPLTITENGTADDYSVLCIEHALLNGSSGSAISSNGIDVSWFVEQATASGANATIGATWKTIDELTGFDNTHCMVARYNGTEWKFITAQAGLASGNTYKTISRSGFSNFGYFTVLSGNPSAAFATNVFNHKDNTTLNAQTNFSPRIYPTIVQNNLNIEVPAIKNVQKMNITVLNVAGKTVWQEQDAAFTSQKIALPDLTQGVYVVLIQYDKHQFSQKIVVSR
jgi:hypothetical protein